MVGTSAGICLIYKQLFRPEGTDSLARGTHHMGLDEGLQDIKNAVGALEMIANSPHKENFIVGLKNCETIITYEEEISEQHGLRNVKEVLDYLLQIPQKYLPEMMHVHLPNDPSYDEVEPILNKHGKTLKVANAVKEKDFTSRILRKIITGRSRYTFQVSDMNPKEQP